MKKSWVIGGVTFAGAATASVMVTSSYPVAIWAVGFAAIYKATHKEQRHVCPLAEMAVAAMKEEGDGDVVAIPGKVGADKSRGSTHSA